MNHSTAHSITLWCAIFAKLSKGAERQLAGLRLSMLQYRVLLQLAPENSATASTLRLARALTARPASIQAALELLCERGLVLAGSVDRQRECTSDILAAGEEEEVGTLKVSGADPWAIGSEFEKRPDFWMPTTLDSKQNFVRTVQGDILCDEISAGMEHFFSQVQSGIDEESWRLLEEMLYDALAKPGGYFAYFDRETMRGDDLPLSYVLTTMEMFMQVVTTTAKKEASLSFSEFRFLLELFPKRRGVVKRLRARNIATFLRVKRSYVTTTAYKLEELGFLVREPDPDDARGILFGLTSEGSELVERIGDDVATVFEGMFGLRTKSRARMMNLAKRLLISVDATLEA